jgi:N-methylhydantoinase A
MHTYGHDNRAEPVQIVNVRVAAIGTIPPLKVCEKPTRCGADAVKSQRQLWFRETGTVDGTIYDRKRVPSGLEIAGPAVIESIDSTVLVPPGWKAKMDVDGFVLLRKLQDALRDQ